MQSIHIDISYLYIADMRLYPAERRLFLVLSKKQNTIDGLQLIQVCQN